MDNFIFKTYIANDREYFAYGRGDNIIEKDFPFPESLLRLLYLDISSFDSLFKSFEHNVRELAETKDSACAVSISNELKELSETHIYFKLVYLDWEQKLDAARQNNYEKLLPRKEVTHIEANVYMLQSQIKKLISAVLNIDSGDKRSVSEKLAAYLENNRLSREESYSFGSLTTSFEAVDSKTACEVLYPKSIYDLIEFSVRECARREIKMRVCKNCGRWFAVMGRTSAEYCNLTLDSKGRTCKEMGSLILYDRNKRGDAVFKTYRREYKKRFAWIKAGRLTADDFYIWSEKAREKKAACDSGEISAEEFYAWLSRS